MSPSLAKQAERLFDTFAELVRGYQFRDREGICGHDLSVSQCYALDLLSRCEPMTMGELAGALYLEISTMTRVVDQLVLRQLVSREADPNDRRICRIRISRQGQALASKARSDLVQEHKNVLRNIDPKSREAVITAMKLLLTAFNDRQRSLAGSACDSGRRRRTKAG